MKNYNELTEQEKNTLKENRQRKTRRIIELRKNTLITISKNSDSLFSYLDFMSRFKMNDRAVLSTLSTLEIFAQNPNATVLLPRYKWQSIGYEVNDGAKATSVVKTDPKDREVKSYNLFDIKDVNAIDSSKLIKFYPYDKQFHEEVCDYLLMMYHYDMLDMKSKTKELNIILRQIIQREIDTNYVKQKDQIYMHSNVRNPQEFDGLFKNMVQNLLEYTLLPKYGYVNASSKQQIENYYLNQTIDPNVMKYMQVFVINISAKINALIDNQLEISYMNALKLKAEKKQNYENVNKEAVVLQTLFAYNEQLPFTPFYIANMMDQHHTDQEKEMFINFLFQLNQTVESHIGFSCGFNKTAEGCTYFYEEDGQRIEKHITNVELYEIIHTMIINNCYFTPYADVTKEKQSYFMVADKHLNNGEYLTTQQLDDILIQLSNHTRLFQTLDGELSSSADLSKNVQSIFSDEDMTTSNIWFELVAEEQQLTINRTYTQPVHVVSFTVSWNDVTNRLIDLIRKDKIKPMETLTSDHTLDIGMVTNQNPVEVSVSPSLYEDDFEMTVNSCAIRMASQVKEHQKSIDEYIENFKNDNPQMTFEVATRIGFYTALSELIQPLLSEDEQFMYLDHKSLINQYLYNVNYEEGYDNIYEFNIMQSSENLVDSINNYQQFENVLRRLYVSGDNEMIITHNDDYYQIEIKENEFTNHIMVQKEDNAYKIKQINGEEINTQNDDYFNQQEQFITIMDQNFENCYLARLDYPYGTLYFSDEDQVIGMDKVSDINSLLNRINKEEFMMSSSLEYKVCRDVVTESLKMIGAKGEVEYKGLPYLTLDNHAAYRGSDVFEYLRNTMLQMKLHINKGNEKTKNTIQQLLGVNEQLNTYYKPRTPEQSLEELMSNKQKELYVKLMDTFKDYFDIEVQTSVKGAYYDDGQKNMITIDGNNDSYTLFIQTEEETYNYTITLDKAEKKIRAVENKEDDLLNYLNGDSTKYTNSRIQLMNVDYQFTKGKLVDVNYDQEMSYEEILDSSKILHIKENELSKFVKPKKQKDENLTNTFYSKENPEELITEEMLARVPALYTQEKVPAADKVVHAAYFIPMVSNWTWYMTEYDKESGDAFGLVLDDEVEWGYFNIGELKELNAQRLILEDFPKTFRELKDTELKKQMTEIELRNAFFGQLSFEDKHIDDLSDDSIIDVDATIVAEDELVAVGVGTEFVLATKQDSMSIQLKDTGAILVVDGKEYNLHIGTTFDESTKVDALIDSGKYKPYKIQDCMADSLQKDIEVAIIDFVNKEYEHEHTYSDFTNLYPDLRHIGIAYTTTPDEKYEIQYELNLVDLTATQYVNNEPIDTYDYIKEHGNKEKALKAMLQDIKLGEFSEYVYVNDDQLRNVLGLEIDEEGNFYEPLSKAEQTQDSSSKEYDYFITQKDIEDSIYPYQDHILLLDRFDGPRYVDAVNTDVYGRIVYDMPLPFSDQTKFELMNGKWYFEDHPAQKLIPSRPVLDEFIQHGTGTANSKYRIYRLLNEDLELDKQIKVIRDEYGVSGFLNPTHYLETMISMECNPNGVRIQWNGDYGCKYECNLNYKKVISLLYQYIDNQNYLTEDELKQYEEQMNADPNSFINLHYSQYYKGYDIMDTVEYEGKTYEISSIDENTISLTHGNETITRLKSELEPIIQEQQNKKSSTQTVEQISLDLFDSSPEQEQIIDNFDVQEDYRRISRESGIPLMILSEFPIKGTGYAWNFEGVEFKDTFQSDAEERQTIEQFKNCYREGVISKLMTFGNIINDHICKLENVNDGLMISWYTNNQRNDIKLSWEHAYQWIKNEKLYGKYVEEPITEEIPLEKQRDIEYLLSNYDHNKISDILDYSFSDEELTLLAKLHTQNVQKEKIERLLEDCNLHDEMTNFKNGVYAPYLNDSDIDHSTTENKSDDALDVVETVTTPIEKHDYQLTNKLIGVGTPKERYKNNIQAIKTLKKIESENRNATLEEQEVMAQYVGWGGLADAFDETKWSNEYHELKSLLTENEYDNAIQSTLTSFYTQPIIIESMMKALDQFGFKKGNLLEPAMGIGNFFGMVQNDDICKYGVEIDSLSGRIAQKMYPTAKIQITGFENTNFQNNFFDVAIGNVPFGNFKVNDPEYNKLNMSIHDYFFAKTIDKIRVGGVIAFITSRYTMDERSSKTRQYIAERCDLIGAIRLPNDAFKDVAGTKVTSDIIFLQKRETPAVSMPAWVNSTSIHRKEFLEISELEIKENIRNILFTCSSFDIIDEIQKYAQLDEPIYTVNAKHKKIRLDSVVSIPSSYIKQKIDEEEKKDIEDYIDRNNYLIYMYDKVQDETYHRIIGDTIDAIIDQIYEKCFLDERDLKINAYFNQHPEMVLGDIVIENGRFGEVVNVKSNGDLSEQLSQAISQLSAAIPEVEILVNKSSKNRASYIPATEDVNNYSYAIKNDKIYYRENTMMKEITGNKNKIDNIKQQIAIRDSVVQLLELQVNNATNEEITNEQNKLNELYDNYSKKYGRINDVKNSKLFKDDAKYQLLSSLEILDAKKKFVKKSDIFTKRTIEGHEVVKHVDSPIEALQISLSEKAVVDLDYMSKLCDLGEDEVIEKLKGFIYYDPLIQKWQSSEEYLSGNVREKLRYAEFMAQTEPKYEYNVQALQKVLPEDIPAENITVQIGANWIEPEIYKDFVCEVFKVNPRYIKNSNMMDIVYSPVTGNWKITNKNIVRNDIMINSTYGTERLNALEILERTLNLRDVTIKDKQTDQNGKTIYTVNDKETILATQKKELIQEEFKNWIFADIDRRKYLVKIYNERFNSYRYREYDGSHLVLTGKSNDITLRPHQLNAISRIINNGNTLLAHVVGAGKTYAMIASAMEMKRLGLCKKSLMVVPKHLTKQWGADFIRLYPNANILVADDDDFKTENRKRFCSKIATNNYDAIIIGQTQFEKIPLSKERQILFLNEQIDEITEGIEELKHQSGEKFTIKEMQLFRRNLEQTLTKLRNDTNKDDVITFEQLGVDRLFVDEAHYYKNLYTITKMSNVAGVQTSHAQKSSDLYNKVRYLDEKTDGKGIIFATGTPVSNSMVELYTMQRYLQHNRLYEAGFKHFDSWAATFGETVTSFELKPEGSGYQSKLRFAKFNNLPELMTMFKEVADIQTSDMLALAVPEAEYHDVVLMPTEEQKKYIATLADRANDIRCGKVDSSNDNMLVVTKDGRLAALDQRLVNPELKDHPGSKVNALVDNIYQIYKEYDDVRASQLVFCDQSTPSKDKEKKSSLYDDIKDKLINRGIPEGEIKFMQSCTNDKQKKELFSKVREGEVRVLIGSTDTMGAGTNVQDRLIALHHLDVPWKPSDIEQQEGRIIRQGNMFYDLNKPVHIYRYITKGTFDAYSWQLIESKQRFISQVMTSKTPMRSIEDVDDSTLSYAEVKALATGNPLIKEKMDLDIEVTKLKLLKNNYQSNIYNLQENIKIKLPMQISSFNEVLNAINDDLETLKKHPIKTKENKDGVLVPEVDVKLGEIHYDEESKARSYEHIERLRTTVPYCGEKVVGKYRGLDVTFKDTGTSKELRIKGKHFYCLSDSLFGQYLINSLKKLEERMLSDKKEIETKLERVKKELEIAKEEVTKPFNHNEELIEKMARLTEINNLLAGGSNHKELDEQDDFDQPFDVDDDFDEPLEVETKLLN